MAHDMYDIIIDYLDLVSEPECLQLPNSEVAFNSDLEYVKTNPYVYMLQVEVSALNGLTVVTPK